MHEYRMCAGGGVMIRALFVKSQCEISFIVVAVFYDKNNCHVYRVKPNDFCNI